MGSLDDSQNFSATSQVTVEVHGNGHNGNEALCLEILGTLRRALTKQYNVKLSLYEVGLAFHIPLQKIFSLLHLFPPGSLLCVLC